MTDLMADDTFEPDYGDNEEAVVEEKLVTSKQSTKSDESDDGEIKSGTFFRYKFHCSITKSISSIFRKHETSD